MTQPPRPDAVSPGEPSGSPAAGGEDAWQAWATSLVETVLALADDACVIVAAPPAEARPVLRRRARLGGFVPARHEAVAPWVRLRRVEDHLRGMCVGGEAFGGPFPFGPQEDAALLALGWHRPGRGDGHDYVRFWPDDVPQGAFLARDEAERAVAMVAATFREVLVGEAAPPLVEADPPNSSN